MRALAENNLMARTHENGIARVQAAPVGSARACAILLVLAAFLLAPFVATIGKPQNAGTPQVSQVVSSPTKAGKGCPKKSIPGQPNACASSSVPVAGFDDRSATPGPAAQRSSIAPVCDVALTTQCCGAPPDRPPRFAV